MFWTWILIYIIIGILLLIPILFYTDDTANHIDDNKYPVWYPYIVSIITIVLWLPIFIVYTIYMYKKYNERLF